MLLYSLTGGGGGWLRLVWNVCCIGILKSFDRQSDESLAEIFVVAVGLRLAGTRRKGKRRVRRHASSVFEDIQSHSPTHRPRSSSFLWLISRIF